MRVAKVFKYQEANEKEVPDMDSRPDASFRMTMPVLRLVCLVNMVTITMLH